MLDERALDEKIRTLLQPYASNWTGSLGRGDLVIPQADLSRVVEAIIDVARETIEAPSVASEADLFTELAEARRLASIQEQAARLRRRFVILDRRS